MGQENSPTDPRLCTVLPPFSWVNINILKGNIYIFKLENLPQNFKTFLNHYKKQCTTLYHSLFTFQWLQPQDDPLHHSQEIGRRRRKKQQENGPLRLWPYLTLFFVPLYS